MQRRTLFKAVLNLGILSWFGLPPKLFSANQQIKFTSAEQETFAAYLDTLIPADDFTPSATQVGVPAKMLARLSMRPQPQQIVTAAGQWLNSQAVELAKKSFVELNAEQREKIVAQAERSQENSVPRIFFEMTRREAFVHYYADARSWKGIPDARAPQPLGFLDYASPPQERKG